MTRGARAEALHRLSRQEHPQNLGNQKKGVSGPFFTTVQLVMAGNSGNVGNGGGGALVVHITNEACVTHFKDFQPTNEQTGGCACVALSF